MDDSIERIYFFCNQKICQTDTAADSIELFVSLTTKEGPTLLPAFHKGLFYYQKPCAPGNRMSIVQLCITKEFVEHHHVKEYTHTIPETESKIRICEPGSPSTWDFTDTEIHIPAKLTCEDSVVHNHRLIIPLNAFNIPNTR